MKSQLTPVIILLLPLLCQTLAKSTSQHFDFFFFIQQWPGSYCVTPKSCCFPSTGKPAADFSIHGLWPYYQNGKYPSNCDPSNAFNKSEIRDLIPAMKTNWPALSCPSNDGTKIWKQEWEMHGTCSESVLDQYAHFKTALKLKSQINLLQALTFAGIKPGGTYYHEDFVDAINQGTGFSPYIKCNEDKLGNSQLLKVYMCVDSSGSRLIECPSSLRGNCGSKVKFPTF